MSTKKRNNVLNDQQQRPTVPSPKLIGSQLRRDTPDLRPGRRNLREAVLLLAEKVESLGADVSDVTELLGVEKD